jgi:Golgi SNAP receptor complex protein 1
MDWDDLQRKARGLESKLESRLMQFSKLNSLLGRRASTLGGGGGGGKGDLESGSRHAEDAAEHERVISKLFDDLQVVIDSLGRCMARGTVRRTANAALLQRFREVYRDDRSEFEKVRGSVRAKLERRELFGSLGRTPTTTGSSSATDHLLRERSSIEGSSRAAADVIQQATEAKGALRNQRSALGLSGAKILDIGATFTGVSSLIGRIRQKRTRDNTVIGLVVAGCICFIVYWTLLR